MPADYAMKFMEQSLADRGDGEELKPWRCAFDGQPTTALQTMPLVYDLDSRLLIIRVISHEQIDAHTRNKV